MCANSRFVTDVFFHMAGLYNDQSFRKFVDYKIKLRGYEYFKESLGTDERQRNYDKISIEAGNFPIAFLCKRSNLNILTFFFRALVGEK